MRRAILLATLLLAGCQQQSAPGSSGDEGVAPTPATATLAVVDRAGSSGPFRLDDLDSLTLQVKYTPGVAGKHALRVDVVDPKGKLFFRYPGTLDVVASQPASVSRVLRVRGTNIDRYRMVGAWQFVVNVDGKPLAAASVDLTE